MSLCHVCLDRGEKVRAKWFKLDDGRVLALCPPCFQYFDERGLVVEPA